MEVERFNEYLVRVASLDRASIRRKMVELQRVITAYKTKEGVEEFDYGDFLDDMSLKEIVDYLKEVYLESDIVGELDAEVVLKSLSKYAIEEFVSDRYFLAEDEDEAAKILIESGNIDLPLSDAGNNLPDFRREDTFKLIEDIVNREGWNYLYEILEPQKDKLHII